MERPVKLSLLKLETVQSMVALICSLNVVCALDLSVAFAEPAGAAPRTIGTAATKGSFRVDEATVSGNATLFEGTTVETHKSATTLDLVSGARLSLAAESKGRIFSDRLILDRGSGQMERAVGVRMEARGLTVRTDNGAGSARVVLTGTAYVQVAALAGSVRVLNSQGLLVAAIRPGNALQFALQASGEPSKLSGCLRAASGHYLVTDEVTNVTVEVAGSGLDKESGNRVQVTGALDPARSPVSGATRYIRVSAVKRLSRGCAATDKAAAAGAGGAASNAGGATGSVGGAAGSAGGAAGGGAGGGAAGGATGGGTAGGGVGIGAISVGTIAVIGGVAAAAVIGGLAASGSLSGGSSVSR
jgi:hypothetical protein